MCVFSAAKPPKKHTLVLFEAAGGGLKKNILFRTCYLALANTNFFNQRRTPSFYFDEIDTAWHQ